MGRIYEEVTHVSSDNQIILKCIILERRNATKFLLVMKEFMDTVILTVDYIRRKG